MSQGKSKKKQGKSAPDAPNVAPNGAATEPSFDAATKEWSAITDLTESADSPVDPEALEKAEAPEAPETPEKPEVPQKAEKAEKNVSRPAARRPRTPRRQVGAAPEQEVLPDVLPAPSSDDEASAVPPTAPSVEDMDTWHGIDPETTVDLRNAPDLFVPVRDDAAPPPTVPPPDGAPQNHHLRGLLESLIFASDRPIKTSELAKSAKAQLKEVRDVLSDLRAHYENRGIVLDEVAGGWLFRTNVVYAPFVRDLTGQKPVKLTRAQLETLAILAYRQPITRPEIDEIRGVDSGPVLKMLLERDLIRILGKKDEVGRPILYGTTQVFLEFFNLKSLKDMPTLKEFTELSDESRVIAERELGEPFDAAMARGAEGEDTTAAEAVSEGATAPEAASEHAEATEWSEPIEPRLDATAESLADSPDPAEADPGADDDDESAADDEEAEPPKASSSDEEEFPDDDDEEAEPPKASSSDEEEFPDDDDDDFEDDDDDDWDDDDADDDAEDRDTDVADETSS